MYCLLVGDVVVGIDLALQRVKERLSLARKADRALARDKDKPLVHTSMQVVFNAKPTCEAERLLHEIIMMHALSAEKLGPGGFDRCVDMVLAALDGKHVAQPNELAEPRVASISDINALVASYSQRASFRVTAMIQTALELSGYAGHIVVEKTQSHVSSLELVRGYSFELEQLLPINVSLVSPRTFCIDGFIEQVSEIHHLLEASAEAREPCVLFVRGASDDVKHTLKVNYDRGSLRVLPVGVKFDLDGMNTLADLSVVSGSDLVTSLKGDLISSIKFNEAPRVDRVSVNKNRIIVENSSSYVHVAAHVRNLRERRELETIDDKGKLLDKRIRSLTPNQVVVRLPDDRDYVVSTQAIDYALRAVKAAINYGVTADTRTLVSSELAARVHAQRCVQTLVELGAIVSSAT